MRSGRNREGIAGEICPLCGLRGQEIGVKEGVSLRECRCAHAPVLLAWAWPEGIAGEAAYEAQYAHPTAYHVDEAQANGLPAMADRDSEYREAAFFRLRVLEAVCPAVHTRALLDIGAGTGAFVRMANCDHFNFEAVGLEPNPPLVQAARDKGIPLSVGGWQDIEGSWGVITLHDVLEHITRPYACLAKLRSHLHKEGVLVIEWPEYACPQSYAEGTDWKHVKPRQHICLYSDRAAQILFRRAGLRVLASYRPLRGEIGKIAYYLAKDGKAKDRKEASDAPVV